MTDQKNKQPALDMISEIIQGNPAGKPIPYEPPKIQTYTSEEILEAIGPAQACSPSPCPVGN
ncbi:MAG: hypothetical protein PF482_20010 [Desulfobacteraceae bacterium]|jgi:hypothetical protein|nr:hypothetical protein [Desulfobacteraceae bacterium]